MQQQDLLTVNIDGREIAVSKGTNMIEAAAQLGIEIPHYCYHSKLSVVGNCRMCLVEIGMPMKDRATNEALLDENGKPKIGWMPRPAIACATTAAPGLHVRTNTPIIQDCRNGVMEFLLINHPLDCPICDQAGECRLQEFAFDYGRGASRFIEKKVVKPKRTVLGPRVTLDDERCIMCSRCIRFCQEIPKDDVLGFVDRGSYTTLTCHPGKQLANNYSLNTVDICPVGALTSTDFRFKMRVWFLKETRSICTESSVGVNTTVSSREGTIYRITPRRNDAVNDTWMSDSGRVLYKQVDSESRLVAATVRQTVSSISSACEEAANLLKEGKVAIVGSGHCSVEEQFLLKRLAEATGASSVAVVAHVTEGDGLLISADRTPNTRGALITGLIREVPQPKLTELARGIDAGDLRTILCVREDLGRAGLSPEQLARVRVIYIGTHANSTSDMAEVVVPASTVFEKEGSFINQQFRLQSFERAVPAPQGIRPDVAILGDILGRISGETEPMTTADVWEKMSAAVPALAGMSLATIAPQGVALEVGSLAELSFPEGASLHYEPRQAATV
jgi:NADH-quinone oxidoreductase subunit G